MFAEKNYNAFKPVGHTKRGKVMYKQTILGPLWIILNPLITTVLFNVVFGGIAGLSTDGTPSFLFYMAGNTVWTFFASCINGTANTFVANSFRPDRGGP